MTAINFTAYTEDVSQIKALKSILKALKIKFEFNTEKPYNTDFVKEILEAKKEIENGKATKMTSKDFDKLWK
jgi:hypothetical protein